MPREGKRQKKSTQFTRLIDGMAQSTNRRGYANMSISSVIAEAGVSRPTFYEYFEDREACFAAAMELINAELVARLADSLAGGEGSDAWKAALDVLVGYAEEHPARAQFVMGEAMGGGASALADRDRALVEHARTIERAAAKGKPAELPDIQFRAVLGSVYRMLAARLRRMEPVTPALADELYAWLSAYSRPVGEHRWGNPTPVQGIPRSPEVPEIPIQRMPSGLPSGRPRLSARAIAENQRLRILYAIAKLAETKGYAATTVADINKLAQVRAQTFYSQFADKREAFVAVHELGFQQVMDVTVRAFFSVEGWPERSWEGGLAFTQLLQENPLVANIAFIEAYAVGPRAVQKIEDAHAAFLFFLQDGTMLTETPPSRVGMEAIIAAVFEVMYLQARAGKKMQIAGTLPQIAQVWLTPFLGPDATDSFIDEHLGAPRTVERAARPKPKSAAKPRAAKRGK
jgi:AcrR family transcriptional regulator